MPSFAVIILLTTAVIWGMTWLPLKILHDYGFNGIAISFWVYALMFIAISAFLWRYPTQIKQNWLALLGILLFGGGALLAFNTSMIFGDVIRAMVLFYLLPLWGLIGGRLFLGEKITPIRSIGMGLSIIGAFLVVGGFNAFNSAPSWIDLLAISAGFLFAMNNVIFRATPELPTVLKLNFMFLGTTLLALLALLQMDLSIVPEVSSHAWLTLIGFAMIWMLLANYGTQWAVTQMESGKSSIILILELVTAVVSASLILGETMKPIEMFGGLLIFIAALLETLSARNKQQSNKKPVSQNVAAIPKSYLADQKLKD
ncbi:DMT family transporter [Thiomicrorhabdus sp. 6S2-11]|uniref:DMT family transporter n=1 Tax=Thiomicrorhabdus marina TaxID=2818442 RepID=A0ABS3Q5J2_9GAMM|nr:DMT family transporter [Thiomicrorhabdus marina]MBO1927130.1 DMT family transporter [Thiomicrorhabdus marina]